jgi:hypothetical protein
MNRSGGEPERRWPGDPELNINCRRLVMLLIGGAVPLNQLAIEEV